MRLLLLFFSALIACPAFAEDAAMPGTQIKIDQCAGEPYKRLPAIQKILQAADAFNQQRAKMDAAFSQFAANATSLMNNMGQVDGRIQKNKSKTLQIGEAEKATFAPGCQLLALLPEAEQSLQHLVDSRTGDGSCSHQLTEARIEVHGFISNPVKAANGKIVSFKTPCNPLAKRKVPNISGLRDPAYQITYDRCAPYESLKVIELLRHSVPKLQSIGQQIKTAEHACAAGNPADLKGARARAKNYLDASNYAKFLDLASKGLNKLEEKTCLEDVLRARIRLKNYTKKFRNCPSQVSRPAGLSEDEDFEPEHSMGHDSAE